MHQSSIEIKLTLNIYSLLIDVDDFLLATGEQSMKDITLKSNQILALQNYLKAQS